MKCNNNNKIKNKLAIISIFDDTKIALLDEEKFKINVISKWYLTCWITPKCF